ncbi:MAG: hypothetical protein H6830_07735 [Planctomycetes bacterium]|nr:hypothetical protein [Planctomycetota bacterium]MCB9910290.1 hypothetical protein [Planctomycetota bacterium]HRV81438.1 phenylalanine--tRNA ligase beta subunit-related protein [Planctomycetota bacterium]
MHIEIDDLPLWLPLGFEAVWPAALETLAPCDMPELLACAPEAAARSENVRAEVRNLLRVGGYRPTGRGKPASEYLVRAAEEQGLPTINPAVDILNGVSYWSGIPISVVDLELAQAPFSVRHGAVGEEYIFNPSGQTMRLEGLLCLCDAQGPCANAVKDSQRTKTHAQTTRTFHILWAPRSVAETAQAAFAWYVAETEAAGAVVTTWPE